MDIDEQLRAAADAADARTPADKLDRVRAACAAARDLALEIEDLKSRTSQKNVELMELRYKTLPDLFMSAKVSRLGLDPDGNMPAYEARLRDHYHANITASWPEDKQNEAFDWLEANGQGDLIRRTVAIDFGKGEEKLFQRVITTLQKIKGTEGRVSVKRGVSWNTLTAWLRELYDEGKELGDVELQKLGATVGKVVNIKPAKEK